MKETVAETRARLAGQIQAERAQPFPGEKLEAHDRRLIDSRKDWKRAEQAANDELALERLSLVPSITLYTVAELRDRPQPTTWIYPFVAQSEIMLMVGPPGVGKSFLSLDMALCMATGTKLFGEFRVQPGKVLYIAGEGGPGMTKRVDAWEKTKGIKVSDDRFRIAESGVNLSSETSVLQVIELVKEHKFDLIIADTFRKLTKVESENDPGGITLVANNADRIRNANPGATVLIVHHTNKGGAVNGSVAFRSDFDSIWMMQGDKNNFRMSSRTEDDGKTKNSAGTVVDGMRLMNVTLGTDSHGEPVTSAVVVRASSTPDHTPEPMTEGFDPSVIYTTAEIVKNLMDRQGVSKSSAERMQKNLLDRGELIYVSYGKYKSRAA